MVGAHLAFSACAPLRHVWACRADSGKIIYNAKPLGLASTRAERGTTVEGNGCHSARPRRPRRPFRGARATRLTEEWPLGSCRATRAAGRPRRPARAPPGAAGSWATCVEHGFVRLGLLQAHPGDGHGPRDDVSRPARTAPSMELLLGRLLSSTRRATKSPTLNSTRRATDSPTLKSKWHR